MFMPVSDQLLEDVYNLVNRHGDEPTRAQLARAAKLAVEYRAQQLQRERTARAIARVAEERRALKGQRNA